MIFELSLFFMVILILNVPYLSYRTKRIEKIYSKLEKTRGGFVIKRRCLSIDTFSLPAVKLIYALAFTDEEIIKKSIQLQERVYELKEAKSEKFVELVDKITAEIIVRENKDDE